MDVNAVFKKSPIKFAKVMWPHYQFYDKQREAIESVRDNDETFVPAGHQLGKDFLSGFVALWFFIVHHPCRIITTSVKDDHLMVLWGEIGRFINEAAYPLEYKNGGPLIVKHREIRKVVDGKECKISYIKGMVSEKGEGLAGHHAKYTLLIVDEASGCEDEVYRRADTWAKKKLIIGNPYTCSNFFIRGVEAGDLLAPED